jgi:glycolate oxidase iron-sulfur subunit
MKREDIESTNCHTVATSCPACMMQISDMLSKNKKGIYVKHPVEIYADGVGRKLESWRKRMKT